VTKIRTLRIGYTRLNDNGHDLLGKYMMELNQTSVDIQEKNYK